MPRRVAEPLSFYAIVALFAFLHAEVAKLADAPDLGSGGAILRGSSPLLGITPMTQILIFGYSEAKSRLPCRGIASKARTFGTPEPRLPSHAYNLFFVARNSSWTQEIRCSLWPTEWLPHSTRHGLANKNAASDPLATATGNN